LSRTRTGGPLRLARVEQFFTEHGTELLVLNNEQLWPEQELVQGLLTIVDGFSAHLYGLRNDPKNLNEALATDVR
jgi:putative resolvase